jgi:hypothetical protein
MATLALGMWAGTSAGPVNASTVMPVQGVASGTLVLTLTGARSVETIAPGDKVITRSGARPVTVVSLALVRAASMVRISAGVLGKDRPEADVLVTGPQPLLIRDWRAKALTGADQAVLNAERLVDGTYIKRETVTDARIVTLCFDEPQVIYADGLEIGCLAG